MALLAAQEIKQIERQFSEGISSATIVDLFQNNGERFSEPTLRKYVQLGLLPKSRRVGCRGRHRGSSGLYPVEVVRLVNEIKRALKAGSTLEEIRLGKVGLVGELQTLRRTSEEVLSRFREAVVRESQRQRRQALQQRLDQHRRNLAREVRELNRFAVQLDNVSQ